MTGKQLRIALIVPSGTPRPWQQRLARGIAQDDRLKLVCLLHDSGATAGSPSLASKLLRRLEVIERRLFVPKAVKHGDDAGNNHASCPAIETADAAALTGALDEVDLVVSLVPVTEDLAASIAERVDLWQLGEGEAAIAHGPAFGLREMFNRDGTSGLCLIERSVRGRVRLAASTVQQQYCYARNKLYLLEKSVPLILRELHRRQAGIAGNSTPLAAGQGALAAQPSVGNLLSYALRLAGHLAPKVRKAVLRKAGRRYNRWSLFVGRNEFQPDRMREAVETRTPENEFWADPFLFQPPGSPDVHVFFENYEFSTGRGKVSVGRLDGDQVVCLGDALVRPYHLSYPFVFAHEGHIYMIPETAQNRQIEIWRADDYPHEWSLYKTVMEGQSCADTTLVEHDGQWWMFTNISTDGFDDHCSELYVFRVDSPLLDRIEPHALNPVVTDARTARNAGRITVRDGRLTRLAQNNAFQYGYGFSLMAVDRLSLSDYSETALFEATPGFAPGVSSTHHMDQLGEVHIFDGLRPFG